MIGRRRLNERGKGATLGVLAVVALLVAALIGGWVGHIVEEQTRAVTTQTERTDAVSDAYKTVNARCADAAGCVPGPSTAEVIRGTDGKKGDPGEQGVEGPQGRRGPQGEIGVSGRPGKDGSDGKDGPAGPAGEPGPAGPVGPAGEPGPAGPAGEPGPAGECPTGSRRAAVTYASGETGYGCVTVTPAR